MASTATGTIPEEHLRALASHIATTGAAGAPALVTLERASAFVTYGPLADALDAVCRRVRDGLDPLEALTEQSEVFPVRFRQAAGLWLNQGTTSLFADYASAAPHAL